jgi:hypothetical protein
MPFSKFKRAVGLPTDDGRANRMDLYALGSEKFQMLFWMAGHFKRVQFSTLAVAHMTGPGIINWSGEE